MSFSAIDTPGTLIVLSTSVAAIAIVFAAYLLLRPGWAFALRNGLILSALIVDLYWAAGRMPGGFAWPAGLGDLFIGLTAPAMTRHVLRGAYSPRVVVLWNLLASSSTRRQLIRWC